MNIIERIKEYIDFKGISKYRFYQETGFSNGFLDKNSNIGSDKCEKIIYQYTDISPEWLLTGKGSMLREALQPSDEPASTPSDALVMRLMDKLDEKDAENRNLQAELRLMEKELATLKAQYPESTTDHPKGLGTSETVKSAHIKKHISGSEHTFDSTNLQTKNP